VLLFELLLGPPHRFLAEHFLDLPVGQLARLLHDVGVHPLPACHLILIVLVLLAVVDFRLIGLDRGVR